jgi:hypothetical protein
VIQKIFEFLFNIFTRNENAGPELSQLDLIKQIYRNHGAQWSRVNILMVLDSSDIVKDVFNDFIIPIIDEKISILIGTVNPGVYYTQNPISEHAKKYGCAHACLGWFPEYGKKGLHNGQKTIIQSGNLTVWRDLSKNFKYDQNELIETGNDFNINWHHAFSQKLIGLNSAGCFNTQDQKQHEKVIETIYATDQEIFGLLIIDISEATEKGII